MREGLEQSSKIPESSPCPGQESPAGRGACVWADVAAAPHRMGWAGSMAAQDLLAPCAPTQRHR